MPSYFRIKGLAGLEGLIVSGEHDGTLLEVHEIRNPDQILGDREVRFTIPPEALYLDKNYLVPIDPLENREYTTASPFGKYLYEGHYAQANESNKLKVDFARYDNGVSVSLSEESLDGNTGRTLYSQNFFNTFADRAIGIIEDTLSGQLDLDDLVFNLRELKSEEN